MLAYLLIMCVSFYIISATLIRLVGEYLFNQKADGMEGLLNPCQ